MLKGPPDCSNYRPAIKQDSRQIGYRHVIQTREQHEHFRTCGRSVTTKDSQLWMLAVALDQVCSIAWRPTVWASASAHRTPAAQEDPPANDRTKDQIHKDLIHRTLIMIRPARFDAEAWDWSHASQGEVDKVARPGCSHLPVSLHRCSVHIYHSRYRLKSQAKTASLNATCTATTASKLILSLRILLCFFTTLQFYWHSYFIDTFFTRLLGNWPHATSDNMWMLLLRKHGTVKRDTHNYINYI